MNIISNAYAQSSSPSDGGMSMLIMVGIFFIIMYFMIIRPQNKRVKEHNKLIESLSNGTEVRLFGCIHGIALQAREVRGRARTLPALMGRTDSKVRKLASFMVRSRHRPLALPWSYLARPSSVLVS